MELANCKCKATGNTCCCEDEPYDGSENLQFKSIIENYDDYLNNKRFVENKQKEYSEKYSSYQRQQKANLRMLKNLFLSEFVDSEKQIKGLCIHATKFKKDPYYQEYLYIIGVNKNEIGEEGMHVPAIRIRFQEKNGQIGNVAFYQEDSYYVDYETLCSCRITEKEFMDVYSRTNFKIMEGLGLNKVDSKY